MSALEVEVKQIHPHTNSTVANHIREHIFSTDPFAHLILKGFLSKVTARKVHIELKEIFKKFYTEENLRDHSVYLSDKGNQRTSHGLQMGSVYCQLPCIDLPRCYEQIYNCSYLYRMILWILGESFCPVHRAFLGWQSYQNNGALVCPHQDGEYLEYEPLKDGGFIAHKNLAPKYVLLFLLQQETGCHGTFLTKRKNDTEGITFNLEVGDAVLFKNTETWHSVPKQPSLPISGIIRETFGFRSWDVNPILIEEEGKKHSQLTTNQSVTLQQQWLTETWPSLFESLDTAVF